VNGWAAHRCVRGTVTPTSRTSRSGWRGTRRASEGSQVRTTATRKRKKPRRAVRGRRSVRSSGDRWSQRVTETSNALDLERSVFTLRDPRAIALSLKQSAERSKRRRSAPFQSAMSMLIFYVNRAGRNLSTDRRRILERAKVELRRVFGRKPAARVGALSARDLGSSSYRPTSPSCCS